MAANVTTYIVETKYVTDDARAKPGLAGITQGANKAAGAVGALKSQLLGIAAVAAGGGLLFGAEKSLIDFNSDMEQLRIRMGGMLSLNLGGNLEDNMETANKLVAELQQRAKISTASTKELAEFLGDTVFPLTKAGAKAQDLAKFTHLAVVAAKGFGDESIAALDIQQALSETGIQVRDRFGMKLLGVMKMTKEHFNELTAPEKLRALTKALENPIFTQMAKKQENTWAGVTSTLKDNLQIALGAVGLPLFKKLTDEVRKWNQWIEQHPVELQNMVNKLSSMIMTAFGFVRDVFKFIIDHQGLLFGLAKSFLVFKGIQFGVGALGAGAKGIVDMATSAVGSFALVGNASAGLASRMVAATGIIGAAAAGLSAAIVGYTSWLEHNTEKEQQLQSRFGGVNKDLADMAARQNAAVFGGQGYNRDPFLAATNRALTSARESGLIDKNNQINKGLVEQAVNAMANDPKSGIVGADMFDRKMSEMTAMLAEALRVEQTGAIKAFKDLREFRETAEGVTKPKERKDAQPCNTHVNIAKVEVPAKDPDRWIQDIGNYADRQVRAPRQARAALAGGGL